MADHLKASIRQHGSAKLTAVTLRMVEARHRGATRDAPGRVVVPATDRQTNDGGGDHDAGRTRRVLQPPRRQLVAVGADVDAAEPLAAPAAIQVALVPAGKPGPLKRIALPHTLSEAQGTNRAPGPCYLQAPHDLDAIRSWLHRYTGPAAGTPRVHALARTAAAVGCHETRHRAVIAVRRRLQRVQGVPRRAGRTVRRAAHRPQLGALATVRPGWPHARQPEMRRLCAARRIRLAREGPVSRWQSVGSRREPGDDYT